MGGSDKQDDPKTDYKLPLDDHRLNDLGDLGKSSARIEFDLFKDTDHSRPSILSHYIC